jgi:hypothetical protein
MQKPAGWRNSEAPPKNENHNLFPRHGFHLAPLGQNLMLTGIPHGAAFGRVASRIEVILARLLQVPH